MSEKYVVVADAAVRLGASRERTIRWIQRGVLSGGRRNGLWYATARSVERLAAKLRKQGV